MSNLPAGGSADRREALQPGAPLRDLPAAHRVAGVVDQVVCRGQRDAACTGPHHRTTLQCGFGQRLHDHGDPTARGDDCECSRMRVDDTARWLTRGAASRYPSQVAGRWLADGLLRLAPDAPDPTATALPPAAIVRRSSPRT
ncbi:MAG: hypothetical protein KDH48_23625, partial [Rhodoferax sp.]|nr:hypothetical protein [Rhodoferax sp.]